MVSKELKEYCRGMYRKNPGPISPELLEKAHGSEAPSFRRPGDMLEPGFEKAKEEAGTLARNEEDVLTYALFPNHAPDFLRSKYGL